MQKVVLFFLVFSSVCFSQEVRIDTIRYYESIQISIASPLEVEITYREDFKKPRMKLLKNSYVGNIVWINEDTRLEKDMNVYISKRKFRKIIKEIKKLNPEEILRLNWDYEENNIVLDGTSSGLYLSNWFENGEPLDLYISNPTIDMEERKLAQYYKVLKLIEEAVMY